MRDQTVVVDVGSGMLKAGFVGRDAPRSIFPTIIGKHKKRFNQLGIEYLKGTYVGDEAVSKRGILDISSPLDRGHVVDWEAMELIWSHVFNNELRISVNEHDIVFSEPCLNTRTSRRKMTEMMFESFKVRGMMVMVDTLLSLFSSGRTSGIVLDCGDGLSKSVPIYDGSIMQQGVRKMDLAGRDLTDIMLKMLKEEGKAFRDREMVQDVKERMCYVAFDFEKEMKHTSCEKSYELPDGDILLIGKESFKCPEVLFQPSDIGMESKGIHELVFESIGSCDLDIQKVLYLNVLLSGGTTMFEGMTERFEKELRLLNESKTKINSPPERKYSVWIGASIVASLSSFQSEIITSQEFEEAGSGIVDRKRCF